METCDTCKWWAPYGSDVPRYPKGTSLCWHHQIGPIDPINTDSEDYASTMTPGGRVVTGPKFGCIHHEPK